MPWSNGGGSGSISGQDHGLLGGLTDDDHAGYHTDADGDARYYQKTEHLNSSAGAGDAGKPLKLDAGGHVDATMINDADIHHGSVGGLTDDDHVAYHTDARGDARYRLGSIYWSLFIEGGSPSRPATAFAAQDEVPTTLRPCDAFDSAADESVILEFTVPKQHQGTGTLKLDILYGANTMTAADDARIDVATEHRTPAAAEALNADNFDGTVDSATLLHSATAYALMVATVTLTPAVAPVAGDRARWKVTRDANESSPGASGLDTLAADLLIVGYVCYEAI